MSSFFAFLSCGIPSLPCIFGPPDTTEATPSTTANYREADFVTGGVKIRASGDQINNSNTHLTFAIGTPIINTDGRIIAGF